MLQINWKRVLRACIVCIAFSYQSAVSAASITGVLCEAPSTGCTGGNTNNAGFTFDTTTNTAALEIQGTIVNTENIGTATLTSGDWRATVLLVLDNFVDDEFTLTVSLKHLLGGDGFSNTFQVLAENFSDGTHTTPFNNTQVTPNGLTLGDETTTHLAGAGTDRFFGQKFEFTVATLLFNQEISTWKYTLNAAHVPLPSAVWLFGSGLMGLVVMTRKRNKVQI